MKLGLFSVSYAGLWGQARLELLSFLDKAAELGFEGVLLMAKRPHLAPLDFDEKALTTIRDRLKALNLKLIGLAAYNDFLLAGPSEVPLREMQVSYIEECARITAFLGGEAVRIFTGYEQPETPFFKQWEAVVTTIGECADRARKYGIQIVLQNHHDLAVDTKSMQLLLSEVGRPNVKAGYDAWSPFLRNENLYQGAMAMGSNTALSIAADYVRLPRYQYQSNLVNYLPVGPDFVRATEMGKGEIDYQSFFKGLSESGFNGWVVYEMCSPLIGGPALANLDLHARAFLSFMKSLS